jgi:hypothetical protein
MKAFAIVAAVAALQGCYKYVPVGAPTAVSPGMEVRAELTDSGTVVLAPQVGPSVYQIDGRLLTRTEDELVLAVDEVTSRRSELAQLWNGERVTVPSAAIGTLRTKKLSRPRTALTTAAIFAAVAGLYIAFDPAGTFGGGGGGRPGGKQ